MALGNFIISGSYTNIHDIHYCKHSNSLAFTVKTYETLSKTTIINEQRKNLTFTIIADVKSMTISSPPSNPEIGDKYYVPQGGSENWYPFIGKLIEWDGSIWTIYTHPIIYVEDTSKYMELKEGIWVENSRVFDLRKFNLYFSIEKIGYTNSSDIIKQIYTYLKTLPEYVSLLDV
jgi:hypothetical protein